MKSQITDITLSYKEPMRGYSKSVANTVSDHGWNASTLEIYSHAGTHMDAPLHFETGNGTIDQVAPSRFFCPCHIVRLAPAEPRMLITNDHLGAVSHLIEPGDGVIFHTGWSQYRDHPALYRDQLPRISIELAGWMVEAGINLVGVEPPSIADVNEIGELQEVHRILLEANILILEGLCNLESIGSDFGQLVALPLKITGGDGAPVRALFIEYN